VDAVSICTPSGLHAKLGVQAARAGKHVITEKPLDITLERCDALIAACDEAGVRLSCVFQMRHTEPIKYLHRAIEEGRFGRLLMGDAYIKWYRTQDYYDSGAWRGTWALDGGGCLMNQGIHTIDALQWMMGPVASVFGHTDTLAHDIEVEDAAAAVVRWESGAIGVIEASTCAKPGLHARIEIHGEKGSAVWQDYALVTWELQDATEEEKAQVLGQTRLAGASEPLAIDLEPHRQQLQSFVNSLLAGEEPHPTGREARKPVEIILAIYDSSKRGEPVRLPLK
jgi:UDP-N-acetyl-2-amino-2-deoxyglucuronate dehydrogenase